MLQNVNLRFIVLLFVENQTQVITGVVTGYILYLTLHIYVFRFSVNNARYYVARVAFEPNCLNTVLSVITINKIKVI